MGLLNPVCEFLIIEHKRRPLGPKALFISRQTVPLSLAALRRLLARHSLSDQNTGPVEYDEETWGASGRQYVTDRYFMRALGIHDYNALDVTDYEGADIVWDLGQPIPEKYHGTFDFIYNGGCFDNMFNPGVAMMNLSKMLKPGGRMVCMESASSYHPPYLMFSPGWFNDFYVFNSYNSCAVYLASYPGHDELMHGPWRMRYVNVPASPNGGPPRPAEGEHLLLVTVAEKGAASSDTIQPIQHEYRTTPELKETFATNQARLRSNAPPLINGAPAPDLSAPYLIDVGSLGDDLNDTQRFDQILDQRPSGAPAHDDSHRRLPHTFLQHQFVSRILAALRR